MSGRGFEDIRVEAEGAVRTISFHREREMNRLRWSTLNELRSALEDAAADPAVRVVVITGAGRSFAAGVSVDEIVGLSVEEAHERSRKGHEVCSLLETMDAITVAAINGFAFGGGSEIALACDIRIGSDRMRIGQPEVTLGIMPGFGATQRLPRIVGAGVAADLILSGAIIDAERALTVGLVSRIYPHREFETHRRAFVEELLRAAPLAQRLAKAAMRMFGRAEPEEALREESRIFSRSFETDEPTIGIRAFQEKEAPEWGAP